MENKEAEKVGNYKDLSQRGKEGDATAIGGSRIQGGSLVMSGTDLSLWTDQNEVVKRCKLRDACRE